MKGYIFRNGVDSLGLFGVRIWFKKNWYSRKVPINNTGFSTLFFDTNNFSALLNAQRYARYHMGVTA